MNLSPPIAILSDLHLHSPLHRHARGNWPAVARSLIPLLDGVQAVIFNGDTFNNYLARNAQYLSEASGILRDTCQANGIKCVFLGGNADHYISDEQHIFLARRRVMVTHGHALLPGMSPWRLNARQIRQARQNAWHDMSEHHRNSLAGQFDSARLALEQIARDDAHDPGLGNTANPLRRYISRFINMLHGPQRILAALDVWQNMPLYAERFLERYARDVRTIIIGHSHHAGLWHVGDKTVINTGSFTSPARPHVAIFTGEMIELWRAKQTTTGLRRDRLIATHLIPPRLI